MGHDRARQTILGPDKEDFEMLSKRLPAAHRLSKVIVPKDSCFS